MCFEQYSHEPNIATVRYWITHGVEMTAERVAALPGKRKGGEAALAVMEGHLGGRRFFVGERYTIADIALYAYTHVASEGGFDLGPYPAVRAWLGRVAAGASARENHGLMAAARTDQRGVKLARPRIPSAFSRSPTSLTAPSKPLAPSSLCSCSSNLSPSLSSSASLKRPR